LSFQASYVESHRLLGILTQILGYIGFSHHNPNTMSDGEVPPPPEPQPFDRYSKLPEALVPTSKQVMKFSGRYVKIDKDLKWFDWKAFLAAINAYQGDELTFDNLKDNTINQQEATLDVMVDKIVKFLLNVLTIALPGADVLALKAAIELTFTTLKAAKQIGFASFSKSSESHNSSWEYRLLFAVPNPDLKDDFYALVTTIKLSADIKEESSWWGLVSSSQKNFSANITAMQLVVTKGFKDPGNTGEPGMFYLFN
jgi:hypothetical protein